ncbi:hypothetical protein D3C71_1803970 [compost metagenome]
MPRVFVVQVPSRREDGEWVAKYDLSPAEAFGEIVPILPPGNVPIDPTPTRRRLVDALRAFDRHSDYLLLLGDPVAIAQAVSVLSAEPGRISVLKWDRRTATYSPYLIG